MKSKFLFLVLLTPFLWLNALLSSSIGAQRPNIVLILADDLGYETVGCYGGQSYSTPNLDRLAAEGLQFNRAYAMPLCTNTRIQLMTGKYNLRNWQAFGILDPSAKTFGHLMQAAGYKTCIAGKWQLTSYDPPDYPGASARRSSGMTIANAGFDEYSLWHTGHTEVKGSRYADPVIEENGRMRNDTQGGYGPDIWTDFIGQFMTKHRDDPFFVYYSMALPHNPMNPTPDSPAWDDPAKRHVDHTPFAADMIEYTDKMVGKVVDQIEGLGLSEKTLVLFFSDNGTNYRVRSNFRGQQVNGQKGKGTEFGVRVPMIAYWKGKILAGRTSEALIDSVDFLPTLLQATGHDKPADTTLDGKSFLPVLLGEKESTRDSVFIHQDPRPGWDKDRFDLIRVAIGKTHKLYDDGRLVPIEHGLFEQHPIWPQADELGDREARRQLRKVLNSYRNYAPFSPRAVPRPDPNANLARHAFQDQGGLVIAEAELFPFPRDEAWQVENWAPDATGLGYLRSLSQQAQPPSIGQTKIRLMIEAAGEYELAVRMRVDHFAPPNQADCWLRHEQDRWQRIAIPASVEVGTWTWVSLGHPIQLSERLNELTLAPANRNVKIDRVVIYRPELSETALDIRTRSSAFHPWASP